jgi:hypothetical protein
MMIAFRIPTLERTVSISAKGVRILFETATQPVGSEPERTKVVRGHSMGRSWRLIVDEQRHGAILTVNDGRFELLGDRAGVAVDLRCRVGHRASSLSACTERYEWPDLAGELMALPRRANKN